MVVGVVLAGLGEFHRYRSGLAPPMTVTKIARGKR
jgi:hypothetical protein